MGPRAVLAPLVRGSTWRRGVFLLLGGVLVLPYVLLAATFVQILTRGEVPRPLVFPLLAVALAIATAPVFLDGSRALEIAAARALLAVDLPEPAAGHPVDRETRPSSPVRGCGKVSYGWCWLGFVPGGRDAAAVGVVA
ncbi:hypothetical protein [Micromonospora sp. DT47]|uniref:hypothetical protein n=1 Tax=Micromonospora sp. DT47 TaxID=3393431 RepID=UPI003CEC4C9E